MLCSESSHSHNSFPLAKLLSLIIHYFVMTQIPCESCAMPVKDGSKYCKYCAPTGELLPLSKIITNMTRWMAKKRGLTEEQAFDMTVGYLKRMPAWKEKLEKIEKG
jgi:hypothetical protein